MAAEWMMRVRDWFRRDRLERELADELQFHRAQLERDATVAGNDDAVLTARRRLGNETRIREESRDRWSMPWIDQLQQDIQYAWRGLRRSPGFTATVVVTLALGIGANVAMFGVIDRLMFRPLPYLIDPGSVNRVYLQTTPRGETFTNTVFPFTRFADIRRESKVFSQYAAFSQQIMAVGVGDDARERNTLSTSASFFSFFYARPAIGRVYTASEDSAGANTDVVVLSYPFWQTQFGGRDVLGQPLQIGSRTYTIIGAMPKGFVGVSEELPPALFIPLAAFALNEGGGNGKTYTSTYSWDFSQIMVRRKSGVTEEMATADLTQAYIRSRDAQRLINPAVAQANVAHPRGIAGPLKTATGPGAGLEAKTLLWVSGVAAIVLLIACANVTNLVLARMLRRKREFAMRLALGISRRRLIAQILTENVLLAFLGSVAAMVVAQWGGAALRNMTLSSEIAREFDTNWRILGVASGIAIMTSLVVSVGPIVLAARGNLSSMLRAGLRETTYQRSNLRSSLLVAQAALSVLLLVGAGLFVRSLENAKSTNLGYSPDRVLLAFPNMRGLKLDSAREVQLNRKLLTAAQAIPDVEIAARVNSRLFSTNSDLVFVDGMDSTAQLGRFVIQYATPEYFGVMKTKILRGRAFDANDRAGTMRVTVVSESMGKALWPGRDALGQCLRVKEKTASCTTVIGVAEDAAYTGLQETKRFAHYVPIEEINPLIGRNIILRVKGSDAAQSIETVRRALQREMPGQGYVIVKPVEEFLAIQRRSWTLGATMFVTFGALALVVAAIGLYGVITYNVTQRMHELGVRVALGAQGRDIVRLVVGQGVLFALAGVAIGLVAAVGASKWIQPLLFDQSARDPLTYAIVGTTLLAVALLASAIPAARASRADPNTVLRNG